MLPVLENIRRQQDNAILNWRETRAGVAKLESFPTARRAAARRARSHSQ